MFCLSAESQNTYFSVLLFLYHYKLLIGSHWLFSFFPNLTLLEQLISKKWLQYFFALSILTACLKLVSPKSLANLVFPEGTKHDFVVKRITYKSDDGDYDTFHSEANSTYLLQHAEATRFNLFTGFQTLAEREDSFKVVRLTDMYYIVVRKLWFHRRV